jgi:hypothetical protein
MQDSTGYLSESALAAAAGLADALEAQQAAGLEALRREMLDTQQAFQVRGCRDLDLLASWSQG